VRCLEPDNRFPTASPPLPSRDRFIAERFFGMCLSLLAELRASRESAAQLAAARAERMPWITSVASKVKAEAEAEALRKEARHSEVQHKVRAAALGGGVFGGAFTVKRKENDDAAREALADAERKERELAKMKRAREKRMKN
jgi:hypothetical protein